MDVLSSSLLLSEFWLVVERVVSRCDISFHITATRLIYVSFVGLELLLVLLSLTS